MSSIPILRQSFSQECETLANQIIHLRQQTSYLYQTLAAFFQRDDQSPLRGFEMHFCRRADKVEMDARRLMRFVIRCGGSVHFQILTKPEVTEWQSPLEALRTAFHAEKQINILLIEMSQAALNTQDPATRQTQRVDLLKQSKLIKKMLDTINILQHVGTNKPFGDFFVDRHVMAPLEQKRQRNIVLRFPKTVENTLVFFTTASRSSQG